MRLVRFLVLTASVVFVQRAAGDFVLYELEGKTRSLYIVLEGRVIDSAPLTVRLIHSKFGELVFSKDDVIICKTEDAKPKLNAALIAAAEAKNADELLKLGVEALKKGHLSPLYRAAEAALEIDPNHKNAKLVMQLREEIKREIPESETEEKVFRDIVKRPAMKIYRSPHFIVMTDVTRSSYAVNSKKTRVEERIELMEKVYESFLGYFAGRGVKLDVPRERLRVVIFNEKRDFDEFAQSKSDTLQNASGFWNSLDNVSYFFEYSTDEDIVSLQNTANRLNDLAKLAKAQRAANRADIIRLAKTLDLLVNVVQEELDIEVLTHEMTHQMAGNTGLLPRDRPIPVWVHEGLASYFEAPKDASWAGIGAVNEGRLEFYRGLEKDRKQSNFDFVTSDQIFTRADNLGRQLHGYGQAWALTHFMMDRHFDELIKFYRLLGSLPPSKFINTERNRRAFESVFPKSDHAKMEREWRAYMASLQTDLEVAIGKKIKEERDKRAKKKRR